MAHILVIEDDEQVRTLVRRALEFAGYTVSEAADGRTGVESYRRAPADAVVTDILMPELDGVEVITALKRLDGDARILAISGGGTLTGTGYLLGARLFGAFATLAKPFTITQLEVAVRGILERAAPAPV